MKQTITYSIIEIIIQPKDMILVSRIMLVHILEQLNFIKALIKEILVVFYNFHTYIHASVQIMCLDSFAECSRSKILSDMITAGNNRV